jgi:hypothetical protein
MLRNLGILSVVLTALMTWGCAKKMAAPPPPPPPAETIADDDNLEQSLFRGDQAVLSDQDIARILGTEVKLTDRRRLAILSLSPINAWSEDLAEIENKNLDNLLQALKSSSQLTRFDFCRRIWCRKSEPFRTSERRLARVQADLLFVYAARIQSFRRDRFLKSDEVHAQCVAESVLLDVRAGIVLHTAHTPENIAMRKTQADLNFNETVARAESEARGKAVLSLANVLNAYLAQAAK